MKTSQLEGDRKEGGMPGWRNGHLKLSKLLQIDKSVICRAYCHIKMKKKKIFNFGQSLFVSSNAWNLSCYQILLLH